MQRYTDNNNTIRARKHTITTHEMERCKSNWGTTEGLALGELALGYDGYPVPSHSPDPGLALPHCWTIHAILRPVYTF